MQREHQASLGCVVRTGMLEELESQDSFVPQPEWKSMYPDGDNGKPTYCKYYTVGEVAIPHHEPFLAPILIRNSVLFEVWRLSPTIGR
jgi:hypothetical protein